MSNYRKSIDSEALRYDELEDSGYDNCKESLIPESSIQSLLDSIENDVNNIANLLSDIEGLSEINEVKVKLKELSNNLY